MNVKELREALAGLPDDMPVFRGDSEYGPRAANIARQTRVQNNSDCSSKAYHWEWEDWNEFDEPGENTWLPVVLIR